jgi:predicted ATPase/class 3 adenylate cyclase
MNNVAESNLRSPELPAGTVTFLFSDIEGSTELLKRLGDEYSTVLTDQRRILREIFTHWGGKEVDTQGDSFFISFPGANEAVAAAAEIQSSMAVHTWPNDSEVRLRMGIHTGEPMVVEEGYVGLDVHIGARIAQVGHGGQVLLSEMTTAIIRDELPEYLTLQDLGTHVLKDIPQPEPIHQLVITGLPSEYPPLTSLSAHPNNLPVQLTPFVGRRDELVALDSLIADVKHHLISIVGAGGMGKTRLAIAAGEEHLHTVTSSNGKLESRFPNGVFFVPLAPLETTDAIIPAIGKVMGFQFYQGVEPKEQILNYLSRKQMLLLMDNFEHLTSGATLLTDIVQAAPGVKILVTSREKLNLRSEVPFILRGMRFPEEEDVGVTDEPFSAVELFLERTRRIQPDFVSKEDEMKSIGHICRLVEGMPLGVELAASWMEMLSPGEIASEIQRSLDFLEAEMQDAPERHQSIRAVFDYTWSMLSEREQDVLKKISIFRGGFTTEAAREVVGASNRQLLNLVNKSILQRSSGDRLGIHELLRQYGAEKLDHNRAEKEKVRDLHCEYFADFLHEREAGINNGDNREALVEMDNIRTAWKWAVQQGKLLELKKQLESFNSLYVFQGLYSEGEELFRWAEEMLATDQPKGERGIVYGQILGYLGSFRCQIGKYIEGMNLLRQNRN